jgi:hypothetical protein
MFRSVSTRTLKILAALFWTIGALVLISKGAHLLFQANILIPEGRWIGPAIITGLIIGGLKAKFLFSRACHKNLARIDALHRPKLWQFFRPGFFLFLAGMILIGATLSRLAHGNYLYLIAVAILDISIAIALLGSGVIFWRQRT